MSLRKALIVIISFYLTHFVQAKDNAIEIFYDSYSGKVQLPDEKFTMHKPALFQYIGNYNSFKRKLDSSQLVRINQNGLIKLTGRALTAFDGTRSNINLTANESFDFPISRKNSIRVRFNEISVYSPQRFTLFGRGEHDGDIVQMVLSASHNYFSGTLFIDGEIYRLYSQDKFVIEVEKQNLISEGQDTRRNFGLHIRRPTPKSLLNNPKPATPDNPASIDIMILYTPKAKSAIGNYYETEALAQSNVDTMNLVFKNSQVYATANLVYTGEINLVERGDTEQIIEDFGNNQTVHELRERYGADLSQLTFFRDTSSDACGRGVRPNHKDFSDISSLAEDSFQISGHDCGDFTSVHEFGHNMGLSHNPENAQEIDKSAYSWGVGHWIDGQWRTIMSYREPCVTQCPEIPYFSNPNIKIDGYPLGVPHKRDNARVLNVTAPIVARYRESKNLDRLSNLTGQWYDSNFPGSGFNILTIDTKHLFVFYGYAYDRKRLWLISNTPVELSAKNTHTVALYENKVGVFSQPEKQLEKWGVIEVNFDSCQKASATLRGKNDVFTYPNLVPLAQPRDIRCY